MAEIVNPEGLSLFLKNMDSLDEEEIEALIDSVDPQVIAIIERRAYREAGQKFYNLVYPAVVHVRSAKSDSIGFAQIRYALDIEKEPMRQVASRLKCEVACISKGSREFVAAHHLPIPRGMKSEDASDAYAEKRIEQLKEEKSA